MTTSKRSLLPRPARVLAGKALQRALNRTLTLDPEARARLEPFEGKAVELHLDGPDLALRVRIEEGTALVEAPAEDSHVQVHTTPGVVLAMALDANHEVAPGKLEVAGDAGLARQLEGMIRDWTPDLEAFLAGHFGDVVGVPMARAAQTVLRGARRGFTRAREDAAAWVRDEKHLTPTRAEIDDWLDAVDELVDRSERLQQRLELLEREQ